MNTQGSAVLLVVSIISILIIVCAACLRSTTAMMNVVYERGNYQQHLYANKALLDYGIHYAQEQFDVLSQEYASDNQYAIHAWPPTTKEYSAQIDIQRTKSDKLMITAQLFQHNKLVHKLQCYLCRIMDGHTAYYHVQEWQHL